MDGKDNRVKAKWVEREENGGVGKSEKGRRRLRYPAIELDADEWLVTSPLR